MNLGAFSVSLNVKNIHLSKEFYEALGFATIGGDIDQKWIILKNNTTVIGLFEGMLPKNTLTFNPGWDQDGNNTETYTDIRAIQKQLLENNIKVSNPISKTSGPAHILIEDPDGNPILIDQHRA